MSAERVAQLIAEKKDKKLRLKVRRELELQVEAVRDALDAERVEKQRLLELADKTHQRLDLIARLATSLEQSKAAFQHFSDMKLSTARIGQLPHTKDFFHKLNDVNKPMGALPNIGRSSKRTAYTRDHRNGFYLGEREQDQKDKKLVRARSVMELRQATAAATASPSPSPAVSMASVKSLGGTVRYGLGVLSSPDIEGYAKRSCSKTRWYTDHEGRRLLMDVWDMPRVTGGIL